MVTKDSVTMITEDAFNEDKAEIQFLSSKPSCFLLLGKPGCGKSTLAKKFAKLWKCVYLTVPDAIQDAIEKGTENGLQANELLCKGEAVPQTLCLNILKELIESPRIQHHGYIMYGLPLYASEVDDVEQQINFIENLTMKPDYIINLKLPDEDLVGRRKGIKVDPITNQLYTKQHMDEWEKQKEGLDMQGEEVLDEDGGEEEEEDDDDDMQEEEEFDEEGGNEERTAELMDRLTVRNEEFEENIRTDLKQYKEIVLCRLEDYMSQHDQHKVYELDANLPANLIFKNLMNLLQASLVARPAVPLRLQGLEDGEEVAEDTDTEDMLRTLAASKMLAPGFRWRRSRWGRLCPVSLFEGSTKLGNPQFAVGFLDKMYVMSSEMALLKFFDNPRMYLLPPQPSPPCKIIILGAPLSGVTTLANKLREKYHSKVLDMVELIKPRILTIEKNVRKKHYTDLLEKSISTVQQIENEKTKLKKKQKEEAEEEEGDSDEEDKSDEDEVKIEEAEEQPVVVTEQHPMVQQLIEEGVQQLGNDQPPLTTLDYIDCLEESLMRIYKGTDKGPSSGGWILDNFPTTKDQLNMMIERGIVPDDVIVFREDSANNNILNERWENLNRPNGDSSTSLTDAEDEQFKTFQKHVRDFDQQWTSMQSSMRNAHSLEPFIIPCHHDEEEAYAIAIKKVEGSFQYQAWEYTGMDQDEEEEDLAAMADEEEEEHDDDPNKKKPFGETLHFCPVALKNENVLWPGSQENAVKYREKVYFLSTPEARESFMENPNLYLPLDKSLSIPPVRLLLLGAKGCGKTFHGRVLAKKFGLFHISFKDRLQELIIHKTLKKIGTDFVFPEDDDTTIKDDMFGLDDEEEEAEKAVEEDEIPLDLTLFEENIRNNILEGEPLTKETLDEIIPALWKEEPFKSQGFLLECFPRTPEEGRYLSEMGLFPDGALNFAVEDTDICNRLLPPVLERWRKQQARIREAKLKAKNEKLKQREEERAKRKTEKLVEIEEKKAEKLAARQASGVDDENEAEEEEDEFDLDEMIELEMLEEFGDVNDDDEQEEETEDEAVERIKVDLTEKYEDQLTTMENIHEVLQDIAVPIIEIDASRQFHITQYLISKTLNSQVINRSSLFDRCHTITPALSKRLLNQGYKFISRFGRWCPVQLYDSAILPPNVTLANPPVPVIYRRYIYFLSNDECKDRFIQSPSTYLSQLSPKPCVPIKIAITGPPKSGKSTLAKRFAKEYGIVRLSIGEALRNIVTSHEHAHIVKEIKEHLHKGYPVPDELAIQVLELCLLDPLCKSRGFVLDGYPSTRRQMELLRERSIIPYKVIDLTLPDKVIMQRGLKDRKSPERVLPLHDSHTILAIRIACHRRESAPIREFYLTQYKNLFTIDGEKSKWWVYNAAMVEVVQSVSHIQSYIQRVRNHQAASIKYMCVTPDEVQSHIGEFEHYCAVHLEQGELWDCSADESNNLLAEHHGKYYKFSSEEHLYLFIKTPKKYISPLAPNKLPTKEHLPKRRSASYVKKSFPAQLELKGYCPVTYLDGDLRYEAIVPGESVFVVEYKKKLFSLSSEHTLMKFMRSPKKYASLTLPNKLPPKREPVLLSALPMLGYMEQTVCTSVIKALTAVGCMKPKYPYLSPKQSATLYLAYHLKAFNPKSKEYVRDKYKKKLRDFEDSCELISYLSRIMKRKYCEPEDRPIDFNYKLSSFVGLQSSQ